ncbi:hypothetical protein ILUMI_04285 [Ignelater luminosus]|uniref:PiggyBac transposable element-derived protein domain-containing protein n=1 Tax=Ignelater luminosus TaxID=2038154 RepID=A0A8K0D9Z5_IGNLU|nr:hypothetical protein ILUMI_04285 [Ignelater luminosus]
MHNIQNADSVDITVLPPQPDILSDCDEGDDDVTCENKVNDVLVNVEIQLQGPNVCSGDNENFGNQDNNSKTKSSKTTKTMRDNRTNKCPLLNSKEVLILKWNDNKCVTMGTNFDTIESLCKAIRWSKSSQQKLSVPQPNIIETYNKHMGGVDHHDLLVGKYPEITTG